MSSPSFKTSPNNTPSSTVVGVDSLMAQPGVVGLPPIGQSAEAGRADSLSHRHEVNPALALNLLKDIQVLVTAWQQQLRQVVQSIRQLEAQGPMVDGWLESVAETVAPGSSGAAILRHGDADALMQYVESLEQPSSPESLATASGSSEAGGAIAGGVTQYRLCRLDADGTVRSHLCPPEQMAVVSLAIARYQKFRQLSQQRQALEVKLQGVVDQLTGVRAGLQESGDRAAS